MHGYKKAKGRAPQKSSSASGPDAPGKWHEQDVKTATGPNACPHPAAHIQSHTGALATREGAPCSHQWPLPL